jgi:Uncharacterised nucleotidyltransferase
MLGGTIALWARGGPEIGGDLDFMVKPSDADRALDALAGAGMRSERPPEGWLYKAWDGEVGIDLIFRPSGLEMSDAAFQHADELTVSATQMRVMAAEDMLTTKLCSLQEHSLDYETLLQMARSLREQVDWGEVRQRTAGSPFARAFFVMAAGLGVVEESGTLDDPPSGDVRVLP